MPLKIGVLTEEYLLALNKVCEDTINNLDVSEYKRRDLLQENKKIIEDEFKGRRPRILYDYNKDFYYCVGIKSDYHNTFHAGEYYKDSNTLKRLIYHYKYPISRNEKTKYPYLKFDTGILIPKSAVYELDIAKLRAIEKLTTPLISTADMLENNMKYLRNNNHEIENKIHDYCSHYRSIKKDTNYYWGTLRKNGMNQYYGGFLAKGFLFEHAMDIDFHKKVDSYMKGIENKWKRGSLEIKGKDNKIHVISTNDNVSYGFLNELSHIPQIYKLKKAPDGAKISTKASATEHILAATISLNEHIYNKNNVDYGAERKSDYLIMKTNNMKILEAQKGNSKYIFENQKQKGKYGAIIFSNKAKVQNRKVYDIDKNDFIDKLITNTPFLSYTSENKPSYVYFSVLNNEMKTEINSKDVMAEKLSKIISSFMITHNLTYDEDKGVFEGMQSAKYSMYNATTMNDKTLDFQFVHYLVLTEINKRTNLDFSIPSYPLVQKHFYQVIANTSLLSEYSNDAKRICNKIFDRIPELTKEKISLDLGFEDRNKSLSRELER